MNLDDQFRKYEGAAVEAGNEAAAKARGFFATAWAKLKAAPLGVKALAALGALCVLGLVIGLLRMVL